MVRFSIALTLVALLVPRTSAFITIARRFELKPRTAIHVHGQAHSTSPRYLRRTHAHTAVASHASDECSSKLARAYDIAGITSIAGKSFLTFRG